MTQEGRKAHNRANGFWGIQSFVNALEVNFRTRNRPQRCLVLKRRRGEICCVNQNDTNDFVVYLTAWMDKKPVHIVSSMLLYVVNVRRNA